VSEITTKNQIAKGIFGFVFENRDKIDTNIYRTLVHDLGIIIRDDYMAMPYTADKQHAMDELVGGITGN
jgi:hypothetical protein